VVVLLALPVVSNADEAPRPATVKEPKLRAELIRRAEEDQAARRAIDTPMKETGKNWELDEATFESSLYAIRKAELRRLSETLRRVDERNTERLGEIVERYGWPTNTLVGKGGAKAAWLLVQHADANPKFQRKCLDLMARLPAEEVNRTDFAYLTDRVLLAEGKKQVYGTQFTFENGKCKPRPLEDEANVDKRRAEVGLPPLAEYFKQAEAFYGGGPKK
jgi:hypothetical protein